MRGRGHVDHAAVHMDQHSGHTVSHVTAPAEARLAQGCSSGAPRGEPSPRGCRREAALWLALWCLPKVADSTAQVQRVRGAQLAQHQQPRLRQGHGAPPKPRPCPAHALPIRPHGPHARCLRRAPAARVPISSPTTLTGSRTTSVTWRSSSMAKRNPLAVPELGSCATTGRACRL